MTERYQLSSSVLACGRNQFFCPSISLNLSRKLVSKSVRVLVKEKKWRRLDVYKTVLQISNNKKMISNLRKIGRKYYINYP